MHLLRGKKRGKVGSLLLALALTGVLAYWILYAANALPARASIPVAGQRPVTDSVGWTYGTYLVALGETFIGTPYVGGTLEVEGEEQLVVNLEEVDCTTFVEYVLALAAAGMQPEELPHLRTSFRAEREVGKERADEYRAAAVFEGFVDAQRRALFMQELEQYRYRGGRCMGYLSRLHYFTEWLLDNEQRGRLKILRNLPGSVPLSLSLNFMSTHSHLYPRLAGQAILVDSLRVLEQRLTNITLSYLPNSEIAAAEVHLEEGDVIAFVTEVEGLDVSHTGLAMFRDDRLYLLHASTRRNVVERSPQVLSEYIKGMPGVVGIMVARATVPKKAQSCIVQPK